MTAQAREILFINNERHTIFGEPLEAYLEANKEKVKFDYRTTGCWRGYIGTWKLENDKLYLIDLQGTKYNPQTKKHSEVGMDYLFPNQKAVFANWFSGPMEIPQGETLAEYFSTFVGILYLKFTKGVLVDYKSEDCLEKMVNKAQVKDSKRTIGFWERIRGLFLK